MQYLRGGGEQRTSTLRQAVEWFAQEYLPDLKEVSVRFPEDRIASGLSIQTPNLSLAELQTLLLKTVEEKEKSKAGSFINNAAGDIAENAMWKYLTRIPETSRTALLHNYNVKMFHLFTGQGHTDQEFDFIVIFAEYKKYVHIEVKAGKYGGKGWVEQLKKGEAFYNEVLAAIGVEEYKGWEYIPVGAFPSATNQAQVNIGFHIKRV